MIGGIDTRDLSQPLKLCAIFIDTENYTCTVDVRCFLVKDPNHRDLQYEIKDNIAKDRIICVTPRESSSAVGDQYEIKDEIVTHRMNVYYTTRYMICNQ